MTEDEARTKWCPFARAPLVTATGEIAFGACVVNRRAAGGPDASSLCIASACMAWRWNEPWTSQTEEGVGGDLVLRLKRKPGEPKLGFCGLAGQPT